MANKKDMLSSGAARLFSQSASVAGEDAQEGGAVKKTGIERIREEVDGHKMGHVMSGRPRRGAEGAWSRHRNYYTSIVFDKDQYERVLDIARDERLSVKETVYRLIEHGISQYEAGKAADTEINRTKKGGK